MNDHEPPISFPGSEGHIDPAEMPALVEQGLQGAIPAHKRNHLAHCPSCFALFAELSRGRLGHELEMLPCEAPADFVAQGKALHQAEEMHDRPAPIIRPRFAATRRRWATLVPAVAAVVACLVVLQSRTQRSTEQPFSGSPPVLQEALAADSRFGLVHLNISVDDLAESIVYRSETRLDREAIRAALLQLGQEYDPASPSADIAYNRIAGHLALAELGMARNLLDEARRLFQADWRFAFLAAHLAYKESDLQQADSLLTGLAQTHPEQGAVLLNLGLVLDELGDPTGKRLLAEVQNRFPGSFLANRATVRP